MPYVNPDTMVEVANILDRFDEESLRDVFQTQIIDSDLYSNLVKNQLRPLYYAYRRAIGVSNIDEDDLATIKIRFNRTCLMILQMISSKYEFTIDDQWLETAGTKLHTLTLVLYQFFVLDIYYVYQDIISNYINKNAQSIADAFNSIPQDKNVSSIVFEKTLSPEYATIASNIFDATDYVFASMTEDEIFEYLSDKYAPGVVIAKMMENNIIVGDITRRLGDIYKETPALRSKVALETLRSIKDLGYIPTNNLVVEHTTIDSYNSASEESEDPEISTVTDIEDDVDIT